ncbi:hypothetical protein PHPALM_30609 [Phytophthora palmivora]|uniref:Uncharacterized protein n=1 Tax=Phytophthora palmivora TaxID=4796 RepID=A0A2P4X4R6_9STRA|nr:hypothetical protein PHPALM_30609 [Phytophthora palmivora]
MCGPTSFRDGVLNLSQQRGCVLPNVLLGKGESVLPSLSMLDPHHYVHLTRKAFDDPQSNKLMTLADYKLCIMHRQVQILEMMIYGEKVIHLGYRGINMMEITIAGCSVFVVWVDSFVLTARSVDFVCI